jgi:peptidylprolyl isomerase
MRGRILIILSCLLVGLVGCGSDSGTSPGFFYLPLRHLVTTRMGDSLKFNADGLSGPEPKPLIPDMPPPEKPYGKNLINGIGTAAYPGYRVTVELVGYDYETREKFYSSWEVRKPLTFTLGAGEVAEVLEREMREAEIGDAREIVVPPSFAAGAQRLWGAPPDATLVFFVVVLDVRER